MNVEYTGRGITITPKQKQLADSELARIDTIIGRMVSAHVILSEDKYRKIAEVTVSCRGEQLVAVCEALEMESALHDTLQKVEQQAIRQKARTETVRDHPKPIAIPAL